MKKQFNVEKLICIVIMCLIIFSSFALPAAAEGLSVPYKVDGEAKFEIFNPVSRIETGDDAYVKVSASELPDDLYAYEIWLSFNDNYLTYKSAKSGSDNVIQVENYDNGILKIGFSGCITGDLSIDNTLATVEFSAKKSGTTSVTLKGAVILSGEMAYSEYNNINKSTAITVASKYSNTGSSGGSGGGGGGYAGGTVSIIGGTNSVTGVSPTMLPIDTTEPTAEPIIFNDLSEVQWAEEAIFGLYNLGIVSGYDNGGYRPSSNITRAEFSKMICSAFNIVISFEADENEFFDVDADEWYAPYINAAKYAGIINGYEDGSFKPEGSITREEAASIIGRTIEVLEISLSADRLNVNFNDENEISEYAVGYIDRLYTMSLLNGDDNNFFRPADCLSRAETAQMLWNVLSKINQNESDASQNTEIANLSFKADNKSFINYVNNDCYDEDEIILSPESDAEAAEQTAAPIPSDNPSFTEKPDAEPTETPISESTQTPEAVQTSMPNSTFVPDKVFDCKNLDELYEYNNIYAYLIPDDGSRDAFYDDFTTFQRPGYGDADIVLNVPYANQIEVVSYFYAGEELVDFAFETSLDGVTWNDGEYTADYHYAEGKWTRAVYNLKTDCIKFIKINYPKTVNWWTPLISEVSVSFGEPIADSIKVDGCQILTIPRFDEAEYKFEGYVADQIGEKFRGDVVFGINGEAVQGVNISDDGTIKISSDAVADSKINLRCECTEYNLSTDVTVTLKNSLLGDLNNDAIVDYTDRELSLELFSKDKNSADWKLCRDADINGDDVINIADIGFISKSAAMTAESEADSIE